MPIIPPRNHSLLIVDLPILQSSKKCDIKPSTVDVKSVVDVKTDCIVKLDRKRIGPCDLFSCDVKEDVKHFPGTSKYHQMVEKRTIVKDSSEVALWSIGASSNEFS